MSRLKQIRRLPAMTAALAIAGLASATVAFGDTLFADGDGLAPIADQAGGNNLAFAGTVDCGKDSTKPAMVGVRRNGNYGAASVFQNGATVTVDVEEITGTDSSAVTVTFGTDETATDTIDLPSGWQSVNNNDFAADTVTSNVTIHPSASGAGSATIKYRASGTASNDTATTERVHTVSDTMTVSWAAGSCNEPPPTPGTPTLASGSSSPNQGVFGLAWDASTDPDEDPVTYQLQHKDANDVAYSDVTGATALTSNSFSFTSSAPEIPEGTWTYRVRASDGTLQSAYSGGSGPIKVDRTGPSAPTASFDRTPEDTDGDWFKDTVTVSYSGSTDGLLPDLSAGSGVASHGTAQTFGVGGVAPFNTSGTHSYSGTATDNAGNSSDPTTGTVKVDATNPSVSISGCPSGPVIAGSSQSATVSASDDHSGLATDSVQNGASVTLDTSSIGSGSATVTAKDKVGRTAQATCNYSVAYGFVGFLAPINGDAVNAGKTGRTYPIKWRLNRYDTAGNLVLISDAEALALVGQMSAGQSSVSCGSLIGPSDALEEVTTGSTALRYDSVDDQFIYNYKAPSVAGCYAFGIRKHDGVTTKQVNFNFTR